MPVDKAWEEYRESDDFVRDDDEQPYREGYFEGQKSLSPEVREVLEKVGINYMQKITYADKTKPEESRCLHCLCTAVYGSPIEHAADCIVPISQKLLDKE